MVKIKDESLLKIALYHGSSEKFEHFLIKKDLAKTDYNNLVEGYGIYMTEDESIAMTYGNNIYKVEVPKSKVLDTTSKLELKSLINKLSEVVGVNILEEINFNDLYKGVKCGNISVSELYKEISLILENNEDFCMRYEELITLNDDCLFEKIKKAYMELIPDILKYYDGSFNTNIYICVKNPENLLIKEVITL